MTYCAGWVYGDSVLLVGDSAITGRAPPSSAQSSFGQSHRRVRGEHVEEGLLKLAPIGPSAAIAYAGNVGRATEILEFLIAHWSLFDGNLEGLHVALSSSLEPFTPQSEVAFLLAWWSETGPRLARWESSAGFVAESCDQSSIGSVSEAHRDWVDAAVATLRQLGAPQKDVLPAITALAQSFGIHDDLIEQNVGGAMIGLAITSEGISWQSDTGYSLYSRHAPPSAFIGTCVRGNALVVHSSITKVPMAMTNSAVADWRSWMQTWNDRVAFESRRDHYPIVVFIRIEDRLITVVERIPGREGPFMRFHSSGNELLLQTTEALNEVLDQELVPANQVPPYRLVYLREP